MTSIFRFRYEISFLAISLAVSVLIFISSRGLPEPSFEPMGAAFFPGTIAIAAALLVAFKLLRIFANNSTLQKSADSNTVSPSFLKSFCMLLLFIAFVGMVYFFDLAFWACALIFLISSMVLLKRPTSIKIFIMQCVFLTIFSLIIDYVAIRILYFDL